MDNASTEASEIVPIPNLKRPEWATESIHLGTSLAKPPTEGMSWKREMYRNRFGNTFVSIAICQDYYLRLNEVEEPHATFGKPHVYFDADSTLYEEELTVEQAEHLAQGLLEAVEMLREVTK